MVYALNIVWGIYLTKWWYSYSFWCLWCSQFVCCGPSLLNTCVKQCFVLRLLIIKWYVLRALHTSTIRREKHTKIRNTNIRALFSCKLSLPSFFFLSCCELDNNFPLIFWFFFVSLHLFIFFLYYYIFIIILILFFFISYFMLFSLFVTHFCDWNCLFGDVSLWHR